MHTAAHRKGRLSQMELNSCQGTPLPVSSTAAIWNVLGAPCLGLGYCKGVPQREQGRGTGCAASLLWCGSGRTGCGSGCWDREIDAGGCTHRAGSQAYQMYTAADIQACKGAPSL